MASLDDEQAAICIDISKGMVIKVGTGGSWKRTLLYKLLLEQVDLLNTSSAASSDVVSFSGWRIDFVSDRFACEDEFIVETDGAVGGGCGGTADCGAPSNGSGGGISVGPEPGLSLGWLESLVGTGGGFSGGRPGRFQDMDG